MPDHICEEIRCMVFPKRKVRKEQNTFFSVSKFSLELEDTVSFENYLLWSLGCIQGRQGWGTDIYWASSVYMLGTTAHSCQPSKIGTVITPSFQVQSWGLERPRDQPVVALCARMFPTSDLWHGFLNFNMIDILDDIILCLGELSCALLATKHHPWLPSTIRGL